MFHLRCMVMRGRDGQNLLLFLLTKSLPFTCSTTVCCVICYGCRLYGSCYHASNYLFATCHSSVLVQWEFRFVIQHSGLTVLLVGFKLYICHDNLSCRLYRFLVLCVTIQPLSGMDIHFAVFHVTEVNNNLFKFLKELQMVATCTIE